MVYAEEVNMIRLFSFIIAFLPDIFEKYGFSIKNFHDSGNRFAGASIYMTSDEMEIFLAIERDEITISFRSLFDKKKNNWFSAEVVLAFLGHKGCSGVMGDQNSSLLRDEFKKLVTQFRKEQALETVEMLSKIKKNRSRYVGKCSSGA